jgi:hypothetical protein
MKKQLHQLVLFDQFFSLTDVPNAAYPAAATARMHTTSITNV